VSEFKHCILGKKQLLERGPGKGLSAKGAPPAGTAGTAVVYAKCIPVCARNNVREGCKKSLLRTRYMIF